MRKIAKLPPADRRALFSNTAGKAGMTVAIIEKDFWVCWTLDYLFRRCKWKDSLAFKGGTSLSKAFGLIKRFSEDIDLILDWRILGYDKDEPYEARTDNKQSQFNKEANNRAVIFLRDELLPVIKEDLNTELGINVQIEPDVEGGQTLLFTYPQEFTDPSILQAIRLEIGALAAWTPADSKLIQPYAADYYQHLFTQPTTSVLTVLPKRTFWEKVTILHMEANRPEEKSMPPRYSRHYYDLFCMSDEKAGVKKEAFADLELLTKVVDFKEKFYRSSWAGYDHAKPGTMKLIPPARAMEALEEDYAHMQAMLFSDRPDFQTLIKCIQALETEINQL